MRFHIIYYMKFRLRKYIVVLIIITDNCDSADSYQLLAQKCPLKYHLKKWTLESMSFF